MKPHWSSLIETFAVENAGKFQIRSFVDKKGVSHCEIRAYWRGKLVAGGTGSSFDEAVNNALTAYAASVELSPELVAAADALAKAAVDNYIKELDGESSPITHY